MIISLLFLVADYLVLGANSYSYLQTHTLYLVFLVLRLGYRQQPKFDLPKNTGVERECQVCHRAKPPRFYHCRRCKLCVYRMDHHCEWVGNCIGQHNTKIYLQLLLHLGIHSILEVLIMVYHYSELLSTKTNTFYFCLTAMPTIYAIFETKRLLQDFKRNVQLNQTLVESYKKVRGTPTPLWDMAVEYMGPLSVQWLLPTFVPVDTSKLLETTQPEKTDQEVRQLTYADEYIYGTDEDDEEIQGLCHGHHHGHHHH